MGRPQWLALAVIVLVINVILGILAVDPAHWRATTS